MIFFYEKMAVIYTLYNTCGRAFAGEYQCGIRLYYLMQYILTKNNNILGNYPLKDVVINNEMIQIYSETVSITAEKKS